MTLVAFEQNTCLLTKKHIKSDLQNILDMKAIQLEATEAVRRYRK